jgi:hypothetical protein
MTYGHAERNLAALRMLEAETAELLRGQPHLDSEQSGWLREVTGPVAPAGSRQTGRSAGSARPVENGEPPPLGPQPVSGARADSLCRRVTISWCTASGGWDPSTVNIHSRPA